MTVDFFADLTEVKENLIETWFLAGYSEKKKKKKPKERKKKKERKGNIRNIDFNAFCYFF